MRHPVNSYNKYGDSLARKRRRYFFLKLSGTIVGLILTISAGVYLIFFSSYLKISKLEINGLETINKEGIHSVVNYLKDHKIFGRIALMPYANIIFFDTELLEERLPSKFPEIKYVKISKKFPDKLIVDLTERHPIGTWCDMNKCRYFDDDGVLWGNALRSSGSLLINIDDGRIDAEANDRIGEPLLSAITGSIFELSNAKIIIKNIEIPPELLDDFRIYTTRGYFINLNTGTDIPKQIKSLRILLDNKGPDFHPQYVDLRINDRIYYK